MEALSQDSRTTLQSGTALLRSSIPLTVEKRFFSAANIEFATNQTEGRSYYFHSIAEEIDKMQEFIYRVHLKEHMKQSIYWKSLVIDCNVRLRKLIEMLIELICLSSTNEEIYFRHILLLEELRFFQGKQSDDKMFFGTKAEDKTETKMINKISWIIRT